MQVLTVGIAITHFLLALVFLDMPSPWDAIDSAKEALKVCLLYTPSLSHTCCTPLSLTHLLYTPLSHTLALRPLSPTILLSDVWRQDSVILSVHRTSPENMQEAITDWVCR